jgi:ABC-type multidrug transport system fused ATPase/permease subunit
MASVMILVIPTGLYLIVKQVSSQKGIRVALLRKKEEVDGKVVEMLGGIETIRVLNTVRFEVAKVEKSTEERRKIEIKHHIYMALYDAAKSLNEGFFHNCGDRLIDLSGLPEPYFKRGYLSLRHPVYEYYESTSRDSPHPG